MIEGVPVRQNLKILIQNNDYGADDIDWNSGVLGSCGEYPLNISDGYGLAVREANCVMIETPQGIAQSERLELLIDPIAVRLVNDITRKVELPQ